jgi:CRISPR/Cas system-associated exonuclease Cas4 (RecB family)
MPTLEEFCRTVDGPDVLDTVIICPDATSQRFLQERVPLAQVLRRDEWLRAGEERPDPWTVIVERHAFLQTIIESLRASGHIQLQPTTTESLSFTELFFQFFDELVLAGVWSGDAWDQLFQRLPQHMLQSDLHLLCRVVWEKRAAMAYPTDALTLFNQLNRKPEASRLVFAGFHRFTALERELMKSYGTSARVETLASTHGTPETLKVRRFNHFTDEVEWIFSTAERLARKPHRHIGIIAPPHPQYISKLSALFPLSATQIFEEEQLSLLEALVALQSADGGIDVWHLLLQHPLVKRLRLSREKLQAPLRNVSTANGALRAFEGVLGEARSDDVCGRQLYQRLVSFRKVSAQCLENPTFWKRVLGFLRQRSQHRLPGAIRLPNQSVVELLDYRCAQFSSYSIHFFPGLSQGIYPPKLPEHALLDESTREFLSAGAEALPVLTRSERIEDEYHFFRTNLQLQGFPAYLSYSSDSPEGAESQPSLFLKKLGSRVIVVPRDHAKREERADPVRWGYTTRVLSRVFPVTDGRRIRATAVESYARCPYQFLLSTVLHIRDEEQEKDFSQRLVGTIVHRWLEELTKNPALSVDTTDSTWLHALAVEVLPEELKRDSHQLRFFICALHAHWQPLIRRELERVRTSGRKVFKTEHVFQPLELRHGFTISGRVDRIDEDNGSLVVVDYKTSRSKKVRNDDRNGLGAVLQPFLYPMALAREFLRPVSSSELVFLNDDEPVEPFHVTDVSERLNQMADDWHTGKFSPSPHHKDDCRHCSFRTGCKVGCEASL